VRGRRDEIHPDPEILMARTVTDLLPEEIPEVSRFLVEGFEAPPDATFAAPDVLHWKYFDPRGGPAVPRGFVAREGGRIIGFGAICPGTFHLGGDPAFEVTTMHGIDWLAEKEHRNTGALLILRGLRHAETAYAFGGSDDATRVIQGAGYEMVAAVPIYQRVLRASYRLREPGADPLRRGLRLARDLARRAVDRPRPPAEPVELRRVEAFGPEVDAVLGACSMRVVFTRRRPDTLNHYLRYPRGGISGWLLGRGGRVLGFALLSIVPRGEARVGKVVDCFLAEADPGLWHAASWAMAEELERQGADVVLACGGTDWAASGLSAGGFRPAYPQGAWLRDKKRVIPRDAAFHFSFLEADLAYT
jgi:hypothetical protein